MTVPVLELDQVSIGYRDGDQEQGGKLFHVRQPHVDDSSGTDSASARRR